MRNLRRPNALGLFFLLVGSLLMTGPALAEVKTLTAEATYTMGDGESPSFAEAMVLQKAKQMALEQAGTYVESYTKIRNYDLTEDEIQTIAGGVLQVEVLEKTRTLIGDGLRFYTNIKATVTTDKMDELAQRIKGKNVAAEYKKLQEDYAKMSKELQTWKELIAKNPDGNEREMALEKIRQQERAFASVQKNEAVLFEKLVSGQELFSRAVEQLAQKQSEKSIVERLFQKILHEGHHILIGKPDIAATLRNKDKVEISVPVTLEVNKEVEAAIEDTARSLGGKTEVLIAEGKEKSRLGKATLRLPRNSKKILATFLSSWN